MVGERNAAHLDVIFGRYADFGMNFEAGVALAKLGARLGEDGFVVFGGAQSRLISRGPKFSAGGVAQINKGSPAIASHILAPAGDREVMPTAITAAGGADDNVIAAIGEKMDFRRVGAGIGEDAHNIGAGAFKRA